jgi:hypothetical protein
VIGGVTRLFKKADIREGQIMSVKVDEVKIMSVKVDEVKGVRRGV